ncbi:MAG: hypothetical protein Q8N76_05190 [Candidatus Omnitrophota bacterium]|nr:hypothetical protein [Candidatus Omnitrophota bacterium]
MKKIFVVLLVAIFAVGVVLVSSEAMAAGKDVATKEKPVIKANEQKVVCKFKSKEEMQEFEQLYVAKQATFGRMGVLQAYFSMEQNNIQEIDKQLEKKFNFKMDPNKMYDLNRDGMEIKEAGNVPQQPAPAAQQ